MSDDDGNLAIVIKTITIKVMIFFHFHLGNNNLQDHQIFCLYNLNLNSFAQMMNLHMYEKYEIIGFVLNVVSLLFNRLKLVYR